MSAGTRSFLFSQAGDWREGGVRAGAVPGENGLVQTDVSGFFASAALDAGESGTRWHRLRLAADLPPNTRLTLSLLAADDPETVGDDLPLEARRRLFARYGQTVVNVLDLPLFSLRGRYLWFLLELSAPAETPIRVRSLRVEFPRRAFVDDLPQIYREGDPSSFLARFLMVFQSVYEDYGQRLEDTPALFAPASAPAVCVDWMADWFAVRETAEWDEARLRALLPHMAELCRRKGTCGSVRFLVEAYTGEAPMLIEQFDALALSAAPEKRPLLRRLYGESGRAFTVLVSREAAPGDRERRSLGRLLDYVTPLDALCRLAVLPPEGVLDGHSYLGMNTRLAAQAAQQVGEMELIS